MPAANLLNNRARTCTRLSIRVLFAGIRSLLSQRSATSSYAAIRDQLNSEPREPRSIKRRCHSAGTPLCCRGITFLTSKRSECCQSLLIKVSDMKRFDQANLLIRKLYFAAKCNSNQWTDVTACPVTRTARDHITNVLSSPRKMCTYTVACEPGAGT
jgi:hypothetical protein